MSSQPQPFPATPQARKQQVERKQAKRSDVLYFAGAALVTAGASMFHLRDGFLAAGSFLLFLPMLELIASFIRGVRTRR